MKLNIRFNSFLSIVISELKPRYRMDNIEDNHIKVS